MRQFERPTLAHALSAKLYRRAKEFWRARQAIAATEFALVLPLLVILMLGSVEAARLIISVRSVTLVATTAVEMLSQIATAKVNYVDLHFATDSTMVIFPQMMQDAARKGISWKNDISVSMAGVHFTPNPPTCTSSCSYTANVVWNSGPRTSGHAGLLSPRFPTRRQARRRFPPMSLDQGRRRPRAMPKLSILARAVQHSRHQPLLAAIKSMQRLGAGMAQWNIPLSATACFP